MCGGFALTRKQRFIGFGVCFGVGLLISFLSTVFLYLGINIKMILGVLPAFAVLYTIGNLISLTGTGFLVFLLTFGWFFYSI